MRLVRAVVINVFLIVSFEILTSVEVYSQSPPCCPMDTERSMAKQWRSKSELLIEELQLMAGAAYNEELRPVAGGGTNIKGQRWQTVETSLKENKTDAILWRLWLMTGKPPVVQADEEPLSEFVARNVRTYESYVTAHTDLTCEEINRLGLENAIESFGSPLWVMTLLYLSEKVDFDDSALTIHSIPNRPIIVVPITKDECERRSVALSKWLSANQKQLSWDSDKMRFRSSIGRYVGTEDLFDVVGLRLPGNAQEAEGERRLRPAWTRGRESRLRNE